MTIAKVGEIAIKVLGPDDAALLENVAPGVFDGALVPELATEFLADRRHHIVVALDGGTVVGFASGVHYVHPDKPAELWINEVGVDDAHQGRGIARRIMTRMLDLGRELGCRAAWVGTEKDNVAARRLYASVGGTEEPDTVVYTFAIERPGER